MSLSKTLITGFVTEDPVFQTTSTERSFATMAVATARPNRQPGTGEVVYDVYRVVLWGVRAEHASINVKNGQTVAIEGRMQCRQYKDPVGNDREVWELWADRQVEIIASTPDVEGNVMLVNP